MPPEHKIGKSLIWNDEGKFIEQSWSELKLKIKITQGGLSIVAEDFYEMLHYRSAPFREKTGILREAFSSLTIEARDEDDIKLFGEILYLFLIFPWGKNIEAGWFIYHLVRQEEKNKFDSERAVKVINELYKLNGYAATVLCNTLKSFIEDIDETDTTIYDLILTTGNLNNELLRKMANVNIFISYAKEDIAIANKIKNELEKSSNFNVWKDDFELLPGEKWELKIRKELQKTDFIILCFSKSSVQKTGFFQVEVKEAKRLQEYRPDSKVFLIPVRVDNCEIPFGFEEYQYSDLFNDFDSGIENIRKSIHKNR